MSLVGQWRAIEANLGSEWGDARLQLTVSDAGRFDRAAALLGPAQPYRSGPQVLRFGASRSGTAPGPNAVRRLLERLDREKIAGTLELLSHEEAPAQAEAPRASLVESWTSATASLPADWSDLYAELELLSTDYVERASLRCSPLNPRRDGTRPALRFRVARTFGYGASPQMVVRSLGRCDADGIRGGVAVLRVLCDTDPVHTQGPVWHLAGRTI